MSGFSMDCDLIAVGICSQITASNDYLSRDPIFHMKRKARIRNLIHVSGFDHLSSAAAIFFRRLEYQLHLSFPLILCPV